MTYIDGTDEVLIPHQDIRHAESEDDCQNPSADETLDRLLWGQLN